MPFRVDASAENWKRAWGDICDCTVCSSDSCEISGAHSISIRSGPL